MLEQLTGFDIPRIMRSCAKVKSCSAKRGARRENKIKFNQENKNGCSFLKPDRVNTIAVRIKPHAFCFPSKTKDNQSSRNINLKTGRSHTARKYKAYIVNLSNIKRHPNIQNIIPDSNAITLAPLRPLCFEQWRKTKHHQSVAAAEVN